MTTTPPNRQQRATDHPARLAAGPHRAAQRAGSRRNRPNRARRALSGPVTALGSSAADLTSPSAKLAQTVKASPTGPSAAGRAAVALTGRAGVANHATNPALPSIHYPMTTPGTGCELHAQISEKDSDTRQASRTSDRTPMSCRLKRTRDVLQALRAPPQRRARIPTRIRIHQRLQRSHQLRIRLRQPRPPRTRPTDTTRLEPCPLPQLCDPTLHSVLADPRRTHDSRDPARPTRPSLRRRPQPALTLVQLRPQPPITLNNLRFIDHAPAIRHHNPTSCHSPLIHS